MTTYYIHQNFYEVINLLNLLTSWDCKKSTFINVISKAKMIEKEEMNKPKHG